MKRLLSRLLRMMGLALYWLIEGLVWVLFLAPVLLVYSATVLLHRAAYRCVPRYHRWWLHRRRDEFHVGMEVGISRWVRTGVEMHQGIQFDTGFKERQDWMIVDLSRAEEELVGVRTRVYPWDPYQPDQPPPYDEEPEYVTIWDLPTAEPQEHGFRDGPRRAVDGW